MLKYFFIILFTSTIHTLFAQKLNTKDSISSLQKDSLLGYESFYDIGDVIQDIGRFIKRDTNNVHKTKKRSGISILPNINYNPSIGAQMGIKAVGGLVLGKNPANTNMSTFATAASATTKGILFAYIANDMYTSGNKWNLKGSILVAKMVGMDYGLGIGENAGTTAEDRILLNPDRNPFVYKYTAYAFSQRLYKQILPNLFAGAGVFFELKRNITESSGQSPTPLSIYSERHGLDAENYSNNGLMLNLQYSTRDNPNNAYTGMYTDVVLRANQAWMGSAKNAYQLDTDFRKYWSLSKETENHVLAFWYWGSYRLAGEQPYLELPGTTTDTYGRTGRGYTMGYFKGDSFFYSELEYRFPILNNRFLSGVTFFNVQSANDGKGTKLFQRWQPAGGAGLRILFNKATRTNLSIDYAIGRYGQQGLFLGLNEAF